MPTILSVSWLEAGRLGDRGNAEHIQMVLDKLDFGRVSWRECGRSGTRTALATCHDKAAIEAALQDDATERDWAIFMDGHSVCLTDREQQWVKR